MNELDGLCADCGQPLANHVCPLRAGTVPAVVTVSAGTTRLRRAPSALPNCHFCGLPHTGQRGVDIVCLWLEQANMLQQSGLLDAHGLAPYSPAIWRAVANELERRDAWVKTNGTTMRDWWRARRADTGKPLSGNRRPRASAPPLAASPQPAHSEPEPEPEPEQEPTPPRETDKVAAAKAATAALKAAKKKGRK